MFVTVILGTLLFGLVHSVVASLTFKHIVRGWIGDRAYYGFFRLFYNFFAVLTLLPILVLVVLKPGKFVYDLGGVWQLPTVAARVVGMTGILLSLLQIDFLRFIGVRQAWAFMRGNPLPLPDESLQTDGIFALVRHPLYLFSIILIWSNVRMTAATFAFNLAATAYFMIGSIYEERKLAAEFGGQYRDYQARVPWLLPSSPFSIRRSEHVQKH